MNRLYIFLIEHFVNVKIFDILNELYNIQNYKFYKDKL